MVTETVDRIFQKHSEIREAISHYFDENYPDELKKQVFEPLMKSTELKEGGVVDDGFLGMTSIYYLDFLVNGKLSEDDSYKPLDVFSLEALNDGVFSLEDVIEIRRMYHTSYMGFFKFVSYKNKNTIELRNVISGEIIDMHPSEKEFEIDEKLMRNFMLQQIETLYGCHFACGNGHIFNANNIHIPLHVYKQSLPSLIKCYYSSEQNRRDTYGRFREDQKKFEEAFGQNPVTFYQTDVYKKQLTDHLMRENKFPDRAAAERYVMTHPLTQEIPKLKNGLNVYMNKQGLFIFTDFVTFFNYLPEFENTKDKKKREAFLEAFLYFMLRNPHPADIFFIYEQKHPQAIEQLLKAYNRYFGVKFPDWETFIQFWFPQYPNETPINIEIPPRLKRYVWEQKRIGRNDDCICGSEKKYKKCCGR